MIIQEVITFSKQVCGGCSTPFYMPTDLMNRLIKEHGTFYCPKGCCRNYCGETDETKLMKQLAEEQQKRIRETNALRQEILLKEMDVKNEKKKNVKVKRDLNRLKKGVCPCCNRSFANLHNHLVNEHPHYTGKFSKESDKLHKKINSKSKTK